MKRTVLLLMVLLIISTSFTACKTTNPGGKDTTPAGTTDAVVTGDGFDVPDNINYDGYEFRILTWAPAGVEWQYSTFNVTGEDIGNQVSMACYRRNEKIKEMIGVKVVEDTTGNAVSIDTLRRNYASDSTEYDAYVIKDRFALTAVVENLVAPYSDLPYVDLEEPWWYPTMNSELTLNNVLYFAYGAQNIDCFNSMQIMVFNQKYIRDYNLDNPYTLVKNGTWTIDKLYEMLDEATNDLNGDQKMTGTDDLWGVISTQEFYGNFAAISGERLLKKNEEDIPMLNILNNNRLIDMWQRILGYEKAKEISYIVDVKPVPSAYSVSSSRYVNAANMFANGRGVFLGTAIGYLDYLRNMDDAYGIIPFPALDQKNPGDAYNSYIAGAGNAHIIPMNCPDFERTSVVLETMAYTSYNLLMPTIYEVNTLIKGTRDETAAEMLEMMNNNRIVDLAAAFWFDISAVCYSSFTQKTDTFVSQYTARQAQFEKAIYDTITAIQELTSGNN